MAIRVVEFLNGGYKIRKVCLRMNFENWINGASEVFKHQSLRNQLFSFRISHDFDYLLFFLSEKMRLFDF